MPKCAEDRIEFGKTGWRLIEVVLSGGDLSMQDWGADHGQAEQAA